MQLKATFLSASKPPVYVWLPPALLAALGGFAQIAASYWDLSTHMLRGREGLFASPHLVIMAGGMLCSLMVLVVGLQSLRAPTSDQSILRIARMIRWSVAVEFVSFGFDELWHRTLGPDSFIWSPPHLVIVSACAVSMLAFARLVQHQGRGRGVIIVSSALQAMAMFAWLFLLSESEFRYAHSAEGLWKLHADGSGHPHISPQYAMLMIGPLTNFVFGWLNAGHSPRRQAVQMTLVAAIYTAARWLTIGFMSASALPPIAPPLVLVAIIPCAAQIALGLHPLASMAMFLPTLWGSELVGGSYLAHGILSASPWMLLLSWCLSLACYIMGNRLAARGSLRPTKS